MDIIPYGSMAQLWDELRGASWTCLAYSNHHLDGVLVPGYHLSMTLATLAKAIRSLSGRDKAKLFDRIGAPLEDYLAAKVGEDRFRRASQIRIPWVELKP